jgi:integrase
MARYTVHTSDGPKRKPIYGRRYKEVERKLAEARGDAARGLVFDADNLKLGDYLDRRLADSVADTVRPTTFERYEQIVRVHIRPALGNLKLKNVTPAHVRGLYREKLEAGLSPRTVQYVHVTLHKGLKQAVGDGLIPRNATEAVKPPQVSKEEIRPLTAEQVKTLFESARGDRLEALYTLAVTTGLRQGELLGLKWGDVDLEAGTLQVRRALTTAKGGPVLAAPKTKGSRRTVRLSETALQALRGHLEHQLDEIDRAICTRRTASHVPPSQESPWTAATSPRTDSSPSSSTQGSRRYGSTTFGIRVPRCYSLRTLTQRSCPRC